jgi:hypothetical protein
MADTATSVGDGGGAREKPAAVEASSAAPAAAAAASDEAAGGLLLPDLDFLPRITELVDATAVMNTGAADMSDEALLAARESAKTKVRLRA